MSTYLVFLPAINLGARRKFAKDDIVRVTTSAGFTQVETHINTGNVRVETRLRSRSRIEGTLERAYGADRGFEVPVIAYDVAEFRQIVADVRELGERHTGQHHVCLLKDEPTAEQVAEAAGLGRVGTDEELAERMVLRGRAAHLLIGDSFQGASLSNAAIERVLGDTVATTRRATVLSAVAQKWC